MEAIFKSNRILSLLIMTLGSATCDWSRDSPSNQIKPSFKVQPKLSWPDKPITAPHSILPQCFIQSTSAFSVEWTKNGVPLKNSTNVFILNENQTLRVEQTTAADTGEYSCKGCNSAGCVSHKQYIKIKESWTSPPLITDVHPAEGVGFVELGDSTNISCSFSSGEICFMQTVAWFRDGEILADSDRVTMGTSPCDDGTKTLLLSLRNITEDDLGPYTCFGKNHMGNNSKVISLHLLNATEPNQDDNKILVLSLSISAGCLSVITLLVLVVVRKRCGKQEYNKLGWLKPDLANFEIPEHELAYDVFLSYSSADYDWVQPVLFQKLREDGYQVCADFKDFTPGAAVVDNIIDAIYKSKRTLIVMSQSFLRSVWTQFEVDQALVKAMALRKDVLIVVKIDDCKVPAKLMGMTFLDWSDQKVLPHFWNRLHDALGPPGDFNRSEPPSEDEGTPEQPDIPIESPLKTETSPNDTHVLIGQLLIENTVPTNHFLPPIHNQPIAV